jgi:methyl-accepting chemotaxis protein
MTTTLRDLLRRFTLWAGGAALVVLLGIGLLSARGARSALQRLADQRGTEVAHRAAELVSTYIRERHREIDRIAVDPFVVRAATDAGQSVVARRLDRLTPEALERMFAGTGQIGGTPDLARYFAAYPEGSDFTDVALIERHGLTVLASSRPNRVAHTDDALWTQAMAEGAAETSPAIDSSTGSVTVRYAVAVRPAPTARPIGVIEAVYQLDRLGWLLTGDLGDSSYLQLVSERGDLLFGPEDASERQVPQDRALYDPDNPQRSVLGTDRGEELVVTVPASRGRFPANQAHYWIVFHQPTAVAYALAGTVQRDVWVVAVLVFILAALAMWWLGRWLDRRIVAPVRAAGAIAGRVAGGDLSAVEVTAHTQTGEVGDMMSAVQTMVQALQGLVGAIRTTSDEAAAMAAEISAATEQMSASTEEMTSTTQELTRRAAEQAQLVRAAAQDSASILQIATALAGGAEDSVRRNGELASLARHHKEMLNQSTAQLARLAEEVERGALDAEALRSSAAEIQKFVGQAKAVATQTNMLALNAAIEAARAGPQGRGFAVVADEVRKLASLAAAAATETADTVTGVLNRVAATRDRLQRLAQTGVVAREAAQTAAAGLATVSGEAEANDAWSQEIATSAGEVRRLVDEIAARLTAVAQGTDGLLASAQEIAASSQQQAASTEEIASSANQLAEAADHLQETVKTFRITAEEGEEVEPPSSPPSPAPRLPGEPPVVGPELAPEVAT